MRVGLSTRMVQAAHRSLSKAIATRRHSAPPSLKLTEALALETLNPKPYAQTLNRSEDTRGDAGLKGLLGGGGGLVYAGGFSEGAYQTCGWYRPLKSLGLGLGVFSNVTFRI